MKKLGFLITIVLLSVIAFAQPKTKQTADKPKLVVGLVIDQMRWDFLYRYQNRYGAGGFKRLLNQGFSFENTMIPYVPTYTAVGHSTIYTGSVPALHGIVGNNWYEKSIQRNMYCTSDSTVSTVGNTGNAGKMSPRNLWATTITDELRLATNFKSKVIGISLKDRGAILPAGHSGNAAYWYDAGKWISSTFYMQNLPEWVNQFNAQDMPGNMMKKDWETLYPIDTYTQSTMDLNEYESTISGLKTTTFPHKLSTLDKTKYESFRTTPFANTFSLEFAKAAVDKEQLGKSGNTDFLAVSLSSPDYIGHTFGPNSIEIEDSYLRLDKDIADFLSFLDSRIGAGNYLLFLSADHGVAHVPKFLADNKIPGGIFSDRKLMDTLNKQISSAFGVENTVMSVMNYQVYVNRDLVKKADKSVDDVLEYIMAYMRRQPHITQVFETVEIAEETIPEPVKSMLINGYSMARSGDIQFTAKPGYFDGFTTGTTHGLWNPYDSHIPCIFFGWKVKQGKSYRTTSMADIAPTIAAMLKIQMPNASVGHVLEELVK